MKQFVKYHIAEQLKELGFDEPCLAIYSNKNPNNFIEATHFQKLYQCNKDICNEQAIDEVGQPIFVSFLTYNNSKIPKEFVAAPLYQDVVDWFRETHKIFINIEHIDKFFYNIEDIPYTKSYVDLREVYGSDDYYKVFDDAIDEVIKILKTK